MRLGIAIETSASVEKRMLVLAKLKAGANSEILSERDYGQDVLELLIGVICVEAQFGKFHAERPARYSRKVKRLEFDIRYAPEDCLKGDPKEFVIEFLNISRSKTADLVEKYQLDFDSDRFHADLERYCESREF